MKQITFFLLLLFIVYTQEAKAQFAKDSIYILYPISATFPDGDAAMMKFIADNLKYPQNDMCIEGRVVLSFCVKEDGKIDSIKVIKGIHPAFDEEAIRVVKLMPKWIPAKLNSKPVEQDYTLPITFRKK